MAEPAIKPAIYIDLNGLLRIANLTVLCALIFTSFRLYDNVFVNDETLLLGMLLCVQTDVALLIERTRRDPFVVLLAFSMIFYYAFRLLTLAVYEFSDVFWRYAYDADDTNAALLFMLAANCFLYAGFFVVRYTDPQRISAAGWRATSPGRVVAVLIASIIFTYFGGNYWNEDNIPRALNFLVVMLAPNILLLMALAYYFLYRKSLTSRFSLAIMSLIGAEIVAHTLMGSRSAIVGIIQGCMLVLLAIAGSVKLKSRFVLLGLIASPFVVVALIAAFAISTYNRAARVAGAVPDFGRAVEFVSESGAEVAWAENLDLLIPPIAARAGFFDFSAEIIAHAGEYERVINLPSYGKSVIDNILTPGFDLFDQPKTANALQFAYREWGPPSKRYVAESYQSDQIGIYGEFFVLFGYAALPLLFVFAFTFKSVYVRLRSSNPYTFAMLRIVVLWTFVRAFDSFGLDWTLGEMLPFSLAVALYAFFFSSRRCVGPAVNQANVVAVEPHDR